MKMSTSQQFSLRWNNYVQHITDAFDTLRSDEELVDVTLSCEGRRIYAHKMLLSACSSYFKEVFKENPCKHPVVIFRNVKFEDLVAIVDFMYQGEVNVEQEHLSSFLTTAEMLAVKGLTENTGPSKEKGENRRRQSVLEAPSPPTATPSQDVNHRQQNNHTPTLARPVIPPSKPITPVSFYNPPPRSETPPTKKRKITIVKNHKELNTGTDSVVKRKVKDEVSDYMDDNDSSYSEQETVVLPGYTLTNERDNVELFSSNSTDSQQHLVKSEENSLNEIEKVSIPETSTMLKPGPSSGPTPTDALQENTILEEYLEESGDEEEEEDSPDYEILTADGTYVVQEDSNNQYNIMQLISADDDDEIIDDNDVVDDDDDEIIDDNYDDDYINNTESLGTIHEVTGKDPLKPLKNIEFIYGEGISVNNEIIIGKTPKFQCKDCNASFKRLDSLYKHNSVHKGKTRCEVCKAIFSRVTHLNRHIKAQHPNIEIISRRKKADSAVYLIE